MNNKAALSALGVFIQEESVYLYCRSVEAKTRTYHATASTDGRNFYYYDDTGVIIKKHGTLEDITLTSDFRVTEIEGGYALTYLLRSDKGHKLMLATSHDSVHWYKVGVIKSATHAGVLLSSSLSGERAVLFSGGEEINVSYSENVKNWHKSNKNAFVFEGDAKVNIMHVEQDVRGILVFYVLFDKDNKQYSLEAMRFNAKEQASPLWQQPEILWQQPGDYKYANINPIGVVVYKQELCSYWQEDNGNMLVISHDGAYKRLKQGIHRDEEPLTIRKSKKNPLLTPIKEHMWESEAVFNAAALHADGKVHLVYRAVGDAGVSMFGYAASEDGIHFHTRSKIPAYVPRHEFEGGSGFTPSKINSPFVSGPGFGGCEDPRITRIDGRVYMMYVAFDGWGPPRLALTSIDENDFFSQRWNWDKSVLVSPPGVVDKSGVILPKKVKGKYVVFHRVFPDILIDFVDSLEFDGRTFLTGQYRISPRKHSWDSRKIGVGATPIKTDDGWLVIYNAVDNRDDARYKIGAMLLDTEDPTKLIARSHTPILEPTEKYENEGLKYGVVYPCGAVVKNNTLFVYYGGSDTVICAATANLPQFLSKLKRHEPINLTHSAQNIRFY